MKLDCIKRIWKKVACMLATILICFACGNGDEPAPEPVNPPEPPEENHVNPDDNPTADLAFEAYNNIFLVTQGARQYYREALNKGDEKDYFWQQALDIQMAEDVYLRTKKNAHLILINNLLNTFIEQNVGTTPPGEWGWNEFNDDILWAGLAFARGYQITNNDLFLEKAKYAFDIVYDRGDQGWGWDDDLDGGVWWNNKKEHKSSLSNNPAVILGCYLYEFTGNGKYLTRAVETLDWVIATLYDSSTGGVHEDIYPDGRKGDMGNVYTNGAFVSAAAHLHRLTGVEKYYEVAKKASDYVMNHRTTNGIMARNWREGTWQSEYCRGLGEFIRDNNIWSPYYDWMKVNANAAWSIRRTDYNIMWNDWTQPTPIDDEAGAVECVGGVIMLQIVPQTSPELKTGTDYQIRPKAHIGKNLAVTSAGTEDGASISLEERDTHDSHNFRLIDKGYGYYQLEPQHAPGSVLTANGTTVILSKAEEDNKNQYWKLVYDYQGYHKLKPGNAPLMCLTTDGTQCTLTKEAHKDNERWVFSR